VITPADAVGRVAAEEEASAAGREAAEKAVWEVVTVGAEARAGGARIECAGKARERNASAADAPAEDRGLE
jgi:hypothetical protein